MKMYPHLHQALVARLLDPEFDNHRKARGTAAANAADRVFQTLTADKNFLGLRTTSFVPQAKYDRMPARLKAVSVVVAGDWPDGVPGFPNVLTRGDFDLAWLEATAT